MKEWFLAGGPAGTVAVVLTSMTDNREKKKVNGLCVWGEKEVWDWKAGNKRGWGRVGNAEMDFVYSNKQKNEGCKHFASFKPPFLGGQATISWIFN